MADEKRLRELLHTERGHHFEVLAREYDRLADEFRAKAQAARKSFQDYRSFEVEEK